MNEPRTIACIPCGLSYVGAHDGDLCIQCGKPMNEEAALLALVAARIDGAAWIMMSNDARRNP